MPPSCDFSLGKMDTPMSSKEVTQEGTSGHVVLSRAVLSCSSSLPVHHGRELSQTAGQCLWDESLVTALCWDLKECSPDAGSTEILMFSPSWRCAKGPSSGSIF